LAVIANTNDLYVTANIKETLINKVRPGQRVDVSIDAYPGKTFTGRVDSVGEAANSVFSLIPVQSSSGNFTKVTQLIPVKIRFPELSQMAVKLGMNVSVRIHIK
jgi:multidrug resistance efflux pump